MPIMEGSEPAMLPGGEAKVARKPEAPRIPLINRLEGTAKIGFTPGPKKAAPAFKKRGRKAF